MYLVASSFGPRVVLCVYQSENLYVKHFNWYKLNVSRWWNSSFISLSFPLSLLQYIGIETRSHSRCISRSLAKRPIFLDVIFIEVISGYLIKISTGFGWQGVDRCWILCYFQAMYIVQSANNIKMCQLSSRQSITWTW